MKNTIKLLGIIAIVALVGFSMVSCEDPAANATQLTAGQWSAVGNLPNKNTAHYYSFSVTSGTTYYIWIKDYWSNSVPASETGWASLETTGEYDNGTLAYATTGSGANATAITLAATRTGTVTIKVQCFVSGGKYRIVYATTNTRPAGE